MSKQFLFWLLFLFAVEYYSFVAVKVLLRNISNNWVWGIYALYILLSLAAFWGLYATINWGRGGWPSIVLKYISNIFVGLYLGKILVAAIMLFGDILLIIPNGIKLFTSLGSKPETASEGSRFIGRFTFISQMALFVGGALTAGLTYGMTNRYRYKIRHTKVPINNLPNALKGLRIAQISDIHSGSFDDPEAVSDGIAAIMQEKPDLILFTGDLVNNHATEIEPYISVFKKLKAPLGVYSIFGNHDYGDYVMWASDVAKKENLEQLKNHHAEMGWRLLLNEHLILKHKGKEFALIGVENWGAKGFTQYGKLDLAMNGLQHTTLPLKILMSHDPSHWDAEVRPRYSDINLTLSGHTHGMQFGIDIPGFKWSPVQYFYKQWAGLYQKDKQFLYVNRGFGFLGYQGRLGILPEITILELA